MRESKYQAMSIMELREEMKNLVSDSDDIKRYSPEYAENMVNQDVCWSVLDQKEIALCKQLFN